MKPNINRQVLASSLGLIFSITTTAALAQANAPSATPPDAGQLLNTTRDQQLTLPNKAPALDVQQEVRPALVAPGGVKVKVESFKVTGSTVFAPEALSALIAAYVGRELDLAGLDEAAAVISQHYRNAGFFLARAYLPAQEVESGNLEIAVIEGRLGTIRVSATGTVRLSAEQAQEIVAGSAPLGKPIHEAGVERALMLLNDLPGVDVKSTLVPGASVGTSDLVIETTEGVLVNGSADIDNYGSASTGILRAGATLNVNNPSGVSDQFVLRGMLTGRNMQYVRGAYSLPVGNLGTRVGVSYSDMHYKLGGDFAALDGKGHSGVISLYALHPFVRSRNQNLFGSVNFDDKRLSDSQRGNTVTDKTIKVASMGLSGDMRDAFGGGGMTSGSVTFTGGHLTLSDSANYAANDAKTAKTAGNYTKQTFSLARLQRVDDDWSVYGSVSGQRANKNLDSSEKFSLGGTGVRAYPQGEASADQGLLLNLEGRFNLNGVTDLGNLQLVGFIDSGRVTLHKTAWTGWQPTGVPGYPNTYSLKGVGLGLNLFKDGDFSVRTSLAWKLGSNPGADAAGRDSDNHDRSARFWLQASKQF